MNKLTCSLLLLSLFSQQTSALETSNKLKLSLNHQDYPANSIQQNNGFSNSQLTQLDYRLNLEHYQERHKFVAHYALNYSDGSYQKLQSKLSSSIPITDSEDEKLFDLKHKINNQSTHVLDRLYYGYYSDKTIVKVGRQAISLGNGLFFHPLDMVNPFASDQIDKEYKPGLEMLYTQYLGDAGEDYELIIIPRRTLVSNKVEAKNSSYIFNSHFYIKNSPLGVMIGKDRDNNFIAFSGAIDIKNFTVQSDLLIKEYDSLKTRTSLIINAQTSFEWFNKATLFGVEYYYNGIGMENTSSYQDLSTDLNKAINNQQVFNTRQNYLASNLTIQLDELSNLTPLVILNLDDSSTLLMVNYQRSINDFSEILFSLSFSPSGKNTEYGGLELANNSDTYLATPSNFIFEYKSYF